MWNSGTKKVVRIYNDNKEIQFDIVQSIRSSYFYFFKKLIQRSIKMFKSDSKDIYNVTKGLFQRNVVSLNFLFIKYSTKATVFNIINNNNNNSFLHTKSAY